MSNSSEEEEFTGEEEQEEEEAEESAEEEEDDDDDDDDDEDFNGGDYVDEDEEDMPAVKTKSKSNDLDRKPAAVSSKKVTPPSEEYDSDDDLPLAALAKKRSPTKRPKNGKKKAATASKPAKKKAKKATSSSKTRENNKKAAPKLKKKDSNVSSSGDKSYEWASAALYGTESVKGLLIQRLLCRWWYAITWPDPSDLPDRPPANCDALDGFPGVYVCTSGDNVGKLHDLRDKSKCPSFRNFANKSSEELRDLLLEALEEQKKQLVAAEGPGTATEKELNDMMKWAHRLNANKADNEARKVLKASRLELP